MKFIAFYLLFFLPLYLLGQSWEQVEIFGGNGNEDCRILEAGAGGLIVGGLFNESIQLGDEAFVSQGENDFFIGQLESSGAWSWVVHGGSFLDDELTALRQDAQGNILVAGAYWVSLSLAGALLEAELNPRGLFLARFNPAGELDWLVPFHGSGLKRISDIATDQAGNSYLAGYFEGQFSVQDTVLQAQGNSDLFLAKFSDSGVLQWIIHHGGKDDTRAVTLDLLSNGDIIAGGFYNDTTYIGNQVLAANTFDRDVWLARFSSTGEVVWVRRAGGVFDDEITALCIDAEDHIYVGGYLIGVMMLSESLSIESSNGHPDFYLLQYQPDGTPNWARAMGGDQSQIASGMALTEKGPVLAGSFQGSFSVDGHTASAGAATAGFVIGFNTTGEARWLRTVRAEGSAFINALAINVDNRVFVGGTFNGTITFDATDYQAVSGYDLFIGSLAPAVTPVRSPVTTGGVFAFPNPADSVVHIRASVADFNLFLLDSAGRTLFSGKNVEVINTRPFAPGTYTLWLETGNEIRTQKLLITNQ